MLTGVSDLESKLILYPVAAILNNAAVTILPQSTISRYHSNHFSSVRASTVITASRLVMNHGCNVVIYDSHIVTLILVAVQCIRY